MSRLPIAPAASSDLCRRYRRRMRPTSNRMRTVALRAAAVLVAAPGLLASGCSNDRADTPASTSGSDTPAAASTAAPTVRGDSGGVATVTLTVRDEAGRALRGARVTYPGGSASTGPDGRAQLQVDQPLLLLVAARSRISEPVAVDRDTGRIGVRLLDRTASSGVPRVVFHFGGDLMLGRRYIHPQRPDTARVASGDGGRSARAVVSDLAPLFAAADFSTVNLETVVGELARSAAYPGKRYLLQSPPEVLAALNRLGVDLVTLGNNHTNDWREAGIASTVSALDAAAMPHVGGGSDEARANRPVIATVRGTRVGVLSYTTVTGDFVNDNLPLSGEKIPAQLRSGEEWKYEARRFGWGSPGQSDHIAAAPRRAGEIWRLFLKLEPGLDSRSTAALWAALTAPRAYPELQDWVARRGHGGAARFSSAGVRRGVSELRSKGADLVVVQLHSGFQFAEFPSGFAAKVARTAVDAGADIVIGHHPHVLQGFEWYRGHLIASSLGNLVFDQDFLGTFPTAVLRVVFEGKRVVDARALPVVIDRYRPVPATGEAAQRIIRLLGARSAAPATAERTAPLTITGVVASRRVDGSVAAVVADDRGTGKLRTRRTIVTGQVVLDGEGLADLPPDHLLRADPSSDVAFGRDLLGVGSFDDVTADGDPSGGLHWLLDRAQGAGLVSDARRGEVLHLEPQASAGAQARPVARVTRLDHRFVDPDGTPHDGLASYSLRLSARRSGPIPLVARLDVYYVDDQDPTREPDSYLLRRLRIPVSVPADGGWHRLTVDLPQNAFSAGGKRPATAALLYLQAGAEQAGFVETDGFVEIDDCSLLEWRAASAFPAGSWHEVDALRGRPGETVPLKLG